MYGFLPSPPMWFFYSLLVLAAGSVALAIRGIFILAFRQPARSQLIRTAFYHGVIFLVSSSIIFLLRTPDSLENLLLYPSIPFGSLSGVWLLLLAVDTNLIVGPVALAGAFLNYAALLALVHFFTQRLLRVK